MPETPAEASAFVRHFFSKVVNSGYAAVDASQVRSLSAPECGSCANIVSDIERLKAASTRVPGQRFKVAFAEAAQPEPDGSVIVDFRFSSDPYVEISSSGAVVQQQPAQINQDAQAKVRRSGSSWVVTAVRTV